MPKAYDEWTVLPHGPLEELDTDLWRVEGSLPDMSLKRVMTIVRVEDGRLVLHNPIALDEPTMKELEALGIPSFLIIPNGWHRLDAKVFADRYPAAKVIAPTGSQKKVRDVVASCGSITDLPVSERVHMDHVDGTRDVEAVLHVHTAGSTTLVFNDVVFNMPHCRGLEGWVLKHITQSTGGPRVNRIARLFLVKDKRALRAHFERLAAISDLRRIVMSHHEPISKNAAETLREIAGTL